MLISAGYRHIVPQEYLDIPEFGAINLHKSYLPYNRGANPNVWSILDERPAGVSLHYMTSDVDQGPIIDRRKINVRPDDTAKTLYERLEDAQFTQFTECWPTIRDQEAEVMLQSELNTDGTYHKKEDFVNTWKLDLDENKSVREIINLLRALTYPPYRNAYFEVDGERYYVEINLTKESDRKPQNSPEKNVPQYKESEFK